MTDFLDRHGFALVIAFTAIIGTYLFAALFFWSAYKGFWPPGPTAIIIDVQNELIEWGQGIDDFVRKYGHWGGAIASLATFTVGLIGTIRILRRQLPRRLLQFIQSDNAKLIAARQSLQTVVLEGGRNLRTNERTLFAGPMNRAFSTFSRGGADRGFRELGASVDEVTATIRVVRARAENLSIQLATAHLLRGVVYMSKHEQQPSHSFHFLSAAESELEKAQAAKRDDIDVLVIRARLLMRLARTEEANSCYRFFVESFASQLEQNNALGSRIPEAVEAYELLAKSRVEFAGAKRTQPPLNEGRRDFIAAAELYDRKLSLVGLAEAEKLSQARLYLAASQLARELDQPLNRANHRAAGLASLSGIETPDALHLRHELSIA